MLALSGLDSEGNDRRVGFNGVVFYAFLRTILSRGVKEWDLSALLF